MRANRPKSVRALIPHTPYKRMGALARPPAPFCANARTAALARIGALQPPKSEDAMTKAKTKTPAPHIARQVDRPEFDPRAVAAVARYIADRRRRDTEDAPKPTSYGNGCQDGTALAEQEIFNLAGGYLPDEASRLLDFVFERQPLSEDAIYKRGLFVGYLEVMHTWARLGALAEGVSYGATSAPPTPAAGKAEPPAERSGRARVHGGHVARQAVASPKGTPGGPPARVIRTLLRQ